MPVSIAVVDPTELVGVAERAARAGAEVLLDHFEADGALGTLEIERKARNDLVSIADRSSEAAILQVLREHYPDHRILAEEGGVDAQGGDSSFEWICDPLDGTTNFLQGLPIWCISIACRYRRELVAAVVYDPLRDDLFTAARGRGALRNGRPMTVSRNRDVKDAFLATGFPFRAHPGLDMFLETFRDVFFRVRAIRRCGSAALDLAHVAAGVYDGFWELRLSPWDVAAGALLIEEAGGTVSDWDGGRDYLGSGNIVAGTSVVHPMLLERIRVFASESRIDELVPIERPPVEALPVRE